MIHLLLVAGGGAVGAALRQLISLASLRAFGPNFPYGTMIVNIAGSFAMGILVEVLARRFNASPELRLLLATGFLGGFTTFSSFSLDTAVLWERGSVLLAGLYAGGSAMGSIAALFAGLALARALA